MRNVYLLTGATGVVGSGIVPTLLTQSDAEVRLLMRPNKGQDLTARFNELSKFWLAHYPGMTNALLRSRVSPISGEITEPDLGIAPDVQQDLEKQCTNIIHCAASVRMNLSLLEARATAVAPVERVIELAKRCTQLRKIEFISTVGVGGRRVGPLPERWIEEPREFHNTYEASKAEAENVIQRHIAQGLPATVHRPSMVVGDSVSGAIIHFQIFYFICDFLSGRRTFGIYPDISNGTLDIVPNDFVARAVVAASQDARTVGEVFHLCSGPSRALQLTALRDVVRRLYQAHGRLARLPKLDLSTANFMRLLRTLAIFMPARKRRALGTLPVYLDYLSGVQEFANDITTGKLATFGLQPPDNGMVLETVLEFYLRSIK